MIKIYSVHSAKRSILKRHPPDEIEVPSAILERVAETFGENISAEDSVRRILRDVRVRGDQALRKWSRELDETPANSPFRVDGKQLSSALKFLPAPDREALELSMERIYRFHSAQPISSWFTNDLGGTVGQIIQPHTRVGLYVPGGTASLPSSVLMSAIPAQVAGVNDVVVVAAPTRGTGQIAPVTLAACALAGVTEVYALGGAQAIAALAYGTESVPSVDKIFGPGNLFVTYAKRQVFGVVGVDGLAGPTETVVIADETANHEWIASDLLAQAEHDVLASAILLTPSQQLAESVQSEVGRQMVSLPRRDILSQSLAGRSGIVVTEDLHEAVNLSNNYGPEHLCLSVATPWPLAGKISNAGGIFVGEHSSEVLGDYVAGPSHVMPTGGSSRYASPLNVRDFVHVISLIALDPATAAEMAPVASRLASAEKLEAHARSADYRSKIKKSVTTTRPAVPPHISAICSYSTVDTLEVLSARLGRSVSDIIKLDANENPHGVSPHVRKALASMENPHLYPDPESRVLRHFLSFFTGTSDRNLLAGAGADELIDLILRVMLSPGDAVLNCPPTFGMYAFGSYLNNARVLSIPRQPDFSLDLHGVLTAAEKYAPKIVFLTSPNNPDGSLIPDSVLDRILALPALIVLDEAYIEFAAPNSLGKELSRITEVPERENLIVLRTFSKLAGLAGLRVGYGAFPTWLMPTLWRTKQPYSVNTAAGVAACAALEDPGHLTRTAVKLAEERVRLKDALERVPFLRPYPTRSNFVLCRIIDHNARNLTSYLAQEHGILIRHYDEPELSDHVRISVGKPEQTDVLVRALTSYPNGPATESENKT